MTTLITTELMVENLTLDSGQWCGTWILDLDMLIYPVQGIAFDLVLTTFCLSHGYIKN